MLTRRRLFAGASAAAVAAAASKAARALNPSLLIPLGPPPPPSGGGGGGGGGGGPSGVYINNGIANNSAPSASSNPALPEGLPSNPYTQNTLPNIADSHVGNFFVWVNSVTPPMSSGNTVQFGNMTRRTNAMDRNHDLLSGYAAIGPPNTGEIFTARLMPPGIYPTNADWPNGRQFTGDVLSVSIANPFTGHYQQFLADLGEGTYSGVWNQIGVIINPGGSSSGQLTIQVPQTMKGAAFVHNNPVYSVPKFIGSTLVRTVENVFTIPWSKAAFFSFHFPGYFWWQEPLATAQNNAYNGFAAQMYFDPLTPLDISQLQTSGYLVDPAGNALTHPTLPGQQFGPAIHLSGNLRTFNRNFGLMPSGGGININQEFGVVPGFAPLNIDNSGVIIESIDLIGDSIGVGPVGSPFAGNQ